ncbi:MAG TPA: sigma-70 family RNA polymerase sigma factor [Chryseolinea sp.]|nr:sigma-70 family RNA polymerase sigma factor [Chryseolinea sp.]HPH45364.1 sigma-70 family RNA polymerase sigma factor [Chryseolinea sp.]HPM28717.1 sigma-70 family RNA polymerase sigma factor [Chryseolinea sp.]
MKEEFIACISEHERIIFKVCKMYCRSLDDEQDLFQDILVQLWKSFPSFKKNSKVSTWMYRVALNTAITQLRTNQKKPIQQAIDKNVLQIPNATVDPKDENFDRMMMAIEKLSQVEKAIMVLYMEDHSYREMAEVMGITESNIGFKINQIKSKLKTTLNVLNYGT